MRLHEHEAADIFENAGIPFPERGVASTPEEAEKLAVGLGCPVILKAQVLAGGRGLAGGIIAAENPGEAYSSAGNLLTSEIKGLPVRKILVAKKAVIEKELYFGVTVDGFRGKPAVLVSTEGGISVEETAKRFPGKIASIHTDVNRRLFPYEARNLLKRLGFTSKELVSCAGVLVKLYEVFLSCNALIAEINPIAVLNDGRLMALDAVLEVDDSALFRLYEKIPADHDRTENPLERKGSEIGVTYVDMDGDIGIIASGAGLGMATMDIIARRLHPANFLETGGGITEKLLYDTMELMMMKNGLKAVIINIYGGINPIHDGAKGIVRYIREHNVTIPVVAKALGNRQEETWDILRSGGVHVVIDVATEKAVERLFELVSDQ